MESNAAATLRCRLPILPLNDVVIGLVTGAVGAAGCCAARAMGARIARVARCRIFMCTSVVGRCTDILGACVCLCNRSGVNRPLVLDENLSETIEAAFPHRPTFIDPIDEDVEAGRIEMTRSDSSDLLGSDQSTPCQHL